MEPITSYGEKMVDQLSCGRWRRSLSGITMRRFPEQIGGGGHASKSTEASECREE